MNRYLLLLLPCIVFCLSCDDEYGMGSEPDPENNEQGVFMCMPPELDVTLTRALDRTLIQESVTEQGVSMNISERLWIGTSLSDETDPRTRSTWNDIVWDSNAEIGLFTVKKSVADAYLAGGNPADITCFPFWGEKDGGGYTSVYIVPNGNNSADNPYNYHNANLRVRAGTSRSSIPFFKEAGSEPLNFYGYFPYQHQTQGINYTLPSTSICKVLRADQHEDNLLAMPYTFSASQTAGNIQRHDVMYSVSEEEGGRNRYGNIGKNGQGTVENDNNVHMRFVHSFCRLQFNISAGSYRAGKSTPIELSRLYLAGSKVFVDGTLNLIKGEVTPGNASIIVRDLDLPAGKTYFDLREGNLTISMIVQPTGVIESLDDFRIVCVVDGVEYSCPLKPGVELVTNHVYDVNLVLDPDTKVLLTNGGGAKVVLHDDVDGGGNIINSHQGFEENIVVTWAKSIVIQPEPGWKLLKIIKNGAVLVENPPVGSYTLPIDRPERETTKYEVVCIPNDWYARPGAMTMHLDGLMNDGYVEDQKLISIWRDLTFNGNDGILYNFDLTKYADKVNDTELLVNTLITTDRSGWDTKGLKFDGKDDVVAFPGKINWKASGSEYTVSMYLCVSHGLQTIYHRIISSGDDTSRGFPALVLNSNSSNVRLFGHGEDNNFGSTNPNDNLYFGKNRGIHIIQLDYVYKQTAATAGTVTLYVDGVYRGERALTNGHGTATSPRYKSVPWTSIGGRLTDISRQIQAAYYNVMIYDVALTPTEIKQNYDLNVDRFGTTKTDTGTWAPVP